MNKVQIKKLISKQVQVIVKADQDMAISRWERAKAFAEIHAMIVWEKSPYKSFRGFIAAEFIDIKPGSAYIWAIHYNQMVKWYTWAQIQTMAKTLSFSRAVQAQQKWGTKKKVTLQKFIKYAESIDTNPGQTKSSIPNPNRISLTLPILYVDKFETILAGYGYMIPKHREDPKHGISDALVKYLDTI